MNSFLVIAHAPLASALRECVLHVFPEADSSVCAIDVAPNAPPEETLSQAQLALKMLGTAHTLVLTDLFGATPCNVASKLVDGMHTRLIAGVNLPMLLRAVSYRHESLEALATRAMMGGTQGVIAVNGTAQQNQNRKTSHDQDHRDHQQ